MKSVKRRHPELAHVTPHKLRHTGATLAKQAGTYGGYFLKHSTS